MPRASPPSSSSASTGAKSCRRRALTASGLIDVQVILSGGQVEALAAQGTELQIQADPSAQRRTMQKTEGVFRMYSGDGGILDELMAQAAAHPEIAEFRVIGETARARRSARCA